MADSFSEPTALVATPRTLDKSWSRILRGDRGCAFDAMSLVGAALTIATVSLARMELWPWFPVYIAGATWVIGFVLGTRAQWRSGKQRRLALTQGPLVALGVVEPEAALAKVDKGRRGPVGRALVLMPATSGEEEDASLRDAAQASKLANALAQSLDARAAKDPALAKLREDRFCFARIPLQDLSPDGTPWILTRLIVQSERLGPSAGPVKVGSVVWGIYHAPSDILEQALL